MEIIPAVIILSLIFLFLSINVIRERIRNKTALGHESSISLTRAVRAHANFVEYVPWSVILLKFLLDVQFNIQVVYLFCLMLVMGRCSHAYGIIYAEVKEKKNQIIFRKIGMFFNFMVIISASLCLFYVYLFSIL